ncbi:MAG TPA: PRC-barrel domain-containing protein [Thermoanaerobaculia bacterium]|nr:PRC-barrel domain-containing protein [Thermoanaerobaculia bacterium]
MSGRIVLLSRLSDARLPESEPDPRGWEVYGSDGVKAGEVDDLLVDANSHAVRYLDVDLDRRGAGAPEESPSGLGPITEHLVRETLSDTENEMTGGPSRFPRSRHVLVPVELARIEDGRRISLVDLRSGDMDLLPEYGGDEIDEEGNHALRLRYGLEQEARIR